MVKNVDINVDTIQKNNARFSEQKPQQKNGISCSCSGCLWIIVMSVLLGILVQECKRSTLRLEREKQLQEQLQKTIQNRCTKILDFGNIKK